MILRLATNFLWCVCIPTCIHIVYVSTWGFVNALVRLCIQPCEYVCRMTWSASGALANWIYLLVRIGRRPSTKSESPRKINERKTTFFRKTRFTSTVNYFGSIEHLLAAGIKISFVFSKSKNCDAYQKKIC